jgi:putative thioredoxin
MTALDVTDQTFEHEVIERSREVPVVVDFWADWCGPCHALAPVLEQAVAERDGQVALVKVDVDANPDLATRFGVRGIPALRAFKGGRPVAELVGAQPPQVVSSFLDGLTAAPARERLAEELAQRPGYEEVSEALRAADYGRAFELLLERLRAEPGERDEIRAAMVDLFGDLGDDDPLVTTHRRQLASALY